MTTLLHTTSRTLAEVAAQYVEIAQEVLATRAEDERVQDATWRHLRDASPKTNARTGPTKASVA